MEKDMQIVMKVYAEETEVMTQHLAPLNLTDLYRQLLEFTRATFRQVRATTVRFCLEMLRLGCVR